MPIYKVENKTKFKRGFTNPIGAAVVLEPGKSVELDLSEEFVASVSAATDLKFSTGESSADKSENKELKGSLDAALKTIASNEKTITSLEEQNKALKQALEESTATLKESEKVTKDLQAQLYKTVDALKESDEAKTDSKKGK